MAATSSWKRLTARRAPPAVSRSAASAIRARLSMSSSLARFAAVSAAVPAIRRDVEGEIAQLDAARVGHPAFEHARGGLAVVGDEAAAVATAPGAHEALVAHALERFACGDERDTQAAGEVGLAGEALAVVEHSADDRVGQSLLDELSAAGAVEGENTTARAASTRPVACGIGCPSRCRWSSLATVTRP
jgi:hypothetical protein